MFKFKLHHKDDIELLTDCFEHRPNFSIKEKGFYPVGQYFASYFKYEFAVKLNEYYLRMLNSDLPKGEKRLSMTMPEEYPLDDDSPVPLFSVEDYGSRINFARFRSSLRFSLLHYDKCFIREPVHFGNLDLLSMARPILPENISDENIDKHLPLESLRDLAFKASLKKFFEECLIAFSDQEITDEMLFKAFLNDRAMLHHYAMPKRQEIDHKAHMEEFLANYQGFLDFFRRGFDKARKLALGGVKVYPRIERALNLSSLNMENLMILEYMLYKILEQYMANPITEYHSGCFLCQKVDVMEFLGEFFYFMKEIKSIRIPRYIAFAMVACKTFKIHLSPFKLKSLNKENLDHLVSRIFANKVEIRFNREFNSCPPLGCAIINIFKTLMYAQSTTLFFQKAGNGGWAHMTGEIPMGFLTSILPYNPRYPLEDDHLWCKSGHGIDDCKLRKEALSSIIMFSLISIDSLKKHKEFHDDAMAKGPCCLL